MAFRQAVSSLNVDVLTMVVTILMDIRMDIRDKRDGWPEALLRATCVRVRSDDDFIL